MKFRLIATERSLYRILQRNAHPLLKANLDWKGTPFELVGRCYLYSHFYQQPTRDKHSHSKKSVHDVLSAYIALRVLVPHTTFIHHPTILSMIIAR